MNVAIIALLIPIIAVLGSFILQIMRVRERQQHMSAEHKAALDAVLKEVEGLKSRIQVLEQVVTDEGFDLRREFHRMEGE